MAGDRYLIVNGDDLGASRGVNRGIFETFDHGLLTSASLMVDMPAAAEAASELGDKPGLSIGLHVTLTREGGSLRIHAGDCRRELERQIARFEKLTGRLPTHLDSHHNIHRDPRLGHQFVDFAAELAIPMRESSPARYFSSFYGQWDDETHLEQVSVETLLHMLATEVGPGVTELGCHPGYVGDGFESSYLWEREAEVRTLCAREPAARAAELGIRLISFAELASVAGAVAS